MGCRKACTFSDAVLRFKPAGFLNLKQLLSVPVMAASLRLTQTGEKRNGFGA